VKDAAGPLREPALDTAVSAYLDRLAIAAIGMFNRGRQDISNTELGHDLSALGIESPETEPAESGRRLIGQFFFVHISQARDSTVWQRYEFLHATFGEFLIAWRIVRELADVADSAFGGRRERDPDDRLLYSLLCHSAMAVRSPILEFAAELSAKRADLDLMVRVLEVMLRWYKRRDPTDSYTSYRPTPLDHIAQAAAFSANLVALRIALGGDDQPMPVSVLDPGGADEEHAWRGTVALWRAGLAPDGWQSMMDRLDRHGTMIVQTEDFGPGNNGTPELVAARLVADHKAEARLRFGLAVVDDFLYWREGDDWHDAMRSWIMPALAGYTQHAMFIPPPRGTKAVEIRVIGSLVEQLLRARSRVLGIPPTFLVEMLTHLWPTHSMDLELAFSALRDVDMEKRFMDQLSVIQLEDVSTERVVHRLQGLTRRMLRSRHSLDETEPDISE
jgi:hypothetical protein